MKLPILVLGLAFLLAGCSGTKKGATTTKPKQDFKTTESGLLYKLYPAPTTNQSARKPQPGEIMNMHLVYDNGSDSVLFSSYQNNTPIQVPVMPGNKGGIEDGFQMLSPGDSAVFRISADSLFKNTFHQPLPPFIKPGSFMNFRVKMVDIMNEQQAQAEQQKMMEQEQQKRMALAGEQVKKDEVLIQNYIKEKGLNAKRTDSGLYYIITQPGTGENAAPGKTVKVHYTGTTLDGNKFDSSLDRGQPFEFILGQGQVIRGWDEGIALLNKGAKATLLIPSPMAYGDRSPTPSIPANSVLRFDVELLDVK